MTAKLIPIETERDQSRNAAVEILERALSEAKEGHIVAVGLAVVRPTSHINCAFSPFDNAGLMLGACALLQARIIANMAPKE